MTLEEHHIGYFIVDFVVKPQLRQKAGRIEKQIIYSQNSWRTWKVRFGTAYSKCGKD